MSKTPRIRIPPEVRKYILERDQHHCNSCGATTDLTVDHIIALTNYRSDKWRHQRSQQFANLMSIM